MNVSDWRALPPASTADLYQRERIRWQQRLGWDTTANWNTVETARVTWGLPGFVCHDAGGQIRGWTFYLVRNGRLDVGALAADDPAATAALLDALHQRSRAYQGVAGFLYSDAPGLDAAMAAHAFAGSQFLYLVHPLEALSTVAAPPGTTVWAGDDRDAAARLLQRAYADAGRIFAPHDALDEWQEYVGNLVQDPSCGTFCPSLSRDVRVENELGALAIVTAIGPRSAHLAQIAVEPSLQRRGLAGQLLAHVLADARRAGFIRLSLLVSADNHAARKLYGRLGFTERERFVAIESSVIPCD